MADPEPHQRATLHLGDCLAVLRGLADASVDAVIADPPYGTTACKWDSVIPFAPMWEQLRRVAKPNAAVVLFAAQPFTSALVMSNLAEFKHEWIWEKSRGIGHAAVNERPLKSHESVIVFGRGAITYNPQKWASTPYRPTKGATPGEDSAFTTGSVRYGSTDGSRFPRSVQRFKDAYYADGHYHPTQKPVDLLAYLVRTYTNPGETVLDFCMGSGTAGVACIQEGRRFIGIEREAAYYAIAQRRLAAAQPPLFAEVAD